MHFSLRLATGLSAAALVAGCALVIGDLPEGSDPGPNSGGGAAGGGSGGTGGTAGTGLGGSAGSVGGSAGTAGVAGTAGSGNAAGTAGSAGTGGTTCVNPPCDCDDDKQLAQGGTCGGKDCDDTDPEVFDGQTAWFTKKNKAGNFDYNCKNGDEKRYPITSCGGLLSALSCNGTAQGYYDGSVKCGDTVGFGGCTWDGSAGTLGKCVQSKTSDGPVECH